MRKGQHYKIDALEESGKTVDDAMKEALQVLNITRAYVEITVIN